MLNRSSIKIRQIRLSCTKLCHCYWIPVVGHSEVTLRNAARAYVCSWSFTVSRKRGFMKSIFTNAQALFCCQTQESNSVNWRLTCNWTLPFSYILTCICFSKYLSIYVTSKSLQDFCARSLCQWNRQDCRMETSTRRLTLAGTLNISNISFNIPNSTKPRHAQNQDHLQLLELRSMDCGSI